MSDVLVTKNVKRLFVRKGDNVHALRDVNIKIKKGEFVSIQGPSGSGKTTLLYILGCLDKPTTGKVIIDGIETSKMKEGELAKVRAEKLGFIFQSFNLLPILNAMENVELPMELTKMSKSEMDDRAHELLELVGLEEREQHRPSELSAGEQQRVAIARALANKPSIILADEPTGNLDSKTGKRIMTLLKELNEKTGTTIVVVTHDKNMAQYANTMIYLKDGRITQVRDEGKGLEISEELKIPRNLANKLIRAGYNSVGKIVGATEEDFRKIGKMNMENIWNITKAIKKYNNRQGRR
jgi:putative ABC transport system ATP-binding protein